MHSARHGNSASNAWLCRNGPRIGLGGTTQEHRGRHSHGDRGNERTRVPPASDLWVTHNGPRGNALPDSPASYRRSVRVGSSSDRGPSEDARLRIHEDMDELRAQGLWVMDSGRHGNMASNALLGRKEPRIGVGGTTRSVADGIPAEVVETRTTGDCRFQACG